MSDVGDLLRAVFCEPGLPDGLCANREDHGPHTHEGRSLGRFWCTADQEQREPWRSENRRRQAS